MLTNRLLSRSRPEYEAWLTWSGFDPKDPPEPLAVLGVTEGIRQTDALEVFPRPLPDAQANYTTRDRKSVVEGKTVSVRVDLGGRRTIRKKKDARNDEREGHAIRTKQRRTTKTITNRQ